MLYGVHVMDGIALCMQMCPMYGLPITIKDGEDNGSFAVEIGR